MRRQFLYSLLVMIVVACVSYARQAEGRKTSGDSPVVGTWAGNWQGGSTGKFELTIAKKADGKLGGSLTAHPEGGDSYTSQLKSVDISGSKLTVKLEDPDGEVDITLEGTVDPTAMKGSYSVRSRAQGESIEGGNWEARKK